MNGLTDDFSDEQRKAIFSIVFDSMIVDGQEPSASRKEYLRAVSAVIGMDSELQNEVYKERISYTENAQVVATLPVRERARVAIFMYQMFKLNQTPISPRQISYFRIIDRIASLKDALNESGLIYWKSGIREIF